MVLLCWRESRDDEPRLLVSCKRGNTLYRGAAVGVSRVACDVGVRCRSFGEDGG